MVTQRTEKRKWNTNSQHGGLLFLLFEKDIYHPEDYSAVEIFDDEDLPFGSCYGRKNFKTYCATAAKRAILFKKKGTGNLTKSYRGYIEEAKVVYHDLLEGLKPGCLTEEDDEEYKVESEEEEDDELDADETESLSGLYQDQRFDPVPPPYSMTSDTKTATMKAPSARLRYFIIIPCIATLFHMHQLNKGVVVLRVTTSLADEPTISENKKVIMSVGNEPIAGENVKSMLFESDESIVGENKTGIEETEKEKVKVASGDESVAAENKKGIEETEEENEKVVASTTSPPSDSVAKEEKVDVKEEKGPAIAMLLTNKTWDVKRATYALKSLHYAFHHNMEAPALLFNEGDLSEEQKIMLRNVTDRPIHFPIVDFQQFPDGFNPDTEVKNFSKRSKWGYQQMCRFWAMKIFEHPALDDYSTYMRIDTDSCFFNDIGAIRPHLPGLPFNGKGVVYGSNRMSKEDPRYLEGLLNVTRDYVKAHNLTMKNPELWQRAEEGRNIYTNFEVARIDFFRRPEVMAFQRRIADEEPFGVFRNRWGDACIRLVTLAMFAEKHEITQIQGGTGYVHPCFEGKHPKIDKLYYEQLEKQNRTHFYPVASSTSTT